VSATEGARAPVTVFLVDDHALFRAGVRAELEQISDEVHVVGEAGSVREAVVGIGPPPPPRVGGGGGEAPRGGGPVVWRGGPPAPAGW
jgi:hypothetical protein